MVALTPNPMTQPFCCDITSGTTEEQNEFKRLYDEATKVEHEYNFVFYGFDRNLNENYFLTRISALKWFTRIIPLSEGILILKKMIGEETPKEDISIYVKSIRSNFEMWQKGEIKDGAFSWHLQNNLLHIEKIIQPTE